MIKYLAEYGTAYPKYYIKNYDKMEGLIHQALSEVFSGKQSARNALLGVESALNAAVAGRWDR